MRKSFVAKLRPDLEPKVVANANGPGTLLIPTPLLVAEEIRRVRKGRLITPSQIRELLAKRFGATQTCALTTGIFLNIIAGAAEEQIAAGKPPVAPYWRVVADNGVLNPKVPPGPERQAMHLRAEGHTVEGPTGTGKWRIAGR